MSETTEFITLLFSIGIIFSQIFLAVTLLALLFKKGRRVVFKVFTPSRSLALGLLVSFTALAGSLYYSEIVGFAVCKLCWFQRIFLYPQVFLFAVALWRRDFSVWFYSLPLAAAGVAFAVFHIVVQATAGGVSCGAEISCAKVYLSAIDHITFPVMGATLFFLVALFSGLAYFGNRNTF